MTMLNRQVASYILAEALLIGPPDVARSRARNDNTRPHPCDLRIPVLAQTISVSDLHTLVQSNGAIVCDCRYSLTDADAGRTAFNAQRIPGAQYVDLEQELSGPITSSSGRHPLPDFSAWVKTAARLGLLGDKLVVAYDHGPGVFAARLWWMLAWAGQDHVALLDGGFSEWRKQNLPLQSGDDSPPLVPTKNSAEDREELSTLKSDAGEILRSLGQQSLLVIDAREPQRFSGETEPLDKKAGHIPGSVNRYFALNLQDGRFRDRADIRREFEALLKGRDPLQVIHSCGSGVTACHNLFAMEFAGISGSRLYPGSWSEWIADPARPIETLSE